MSVDGTPIDTLDAQQLKKFNEMQELIASLNLNEEMTTFCSDSTICRYLRARNYDTKKAFKMLQETLEWRASVRPQDLTYDAVKGQAVAGSNYVAGYDQHGHPTCYMRVSRDPKGTPDEKLDLILYNLEECCRRMDASRGIEKLSYIIDMTGFSLSRSGDASVGRRWASILSNHYPERCYLVAVVNAPRIFSMLWRVLSPFIDKVTKEKIHFVGGSMEERQAFFKKHYNDDQIETDFGGLVEFDYTTNTSHVIGRKDDVQESGTTGVTEGTGGFELDADDDDNDQVD